MAVIRPRIETDPVALEQIAHDYLRAHIPGWQPADGDIVTWLIAAHARMVAEERDVADDVPLEQILRPLGEKVHRILPLLAAPATVSATVAVRDTAGYTIPAGLEVLVRTAGDDGIPFVVVAPVTIDPAARSRTTAEGEVTLRAAPGYEGAAGNGLTSANDAVPIRAFDSIDSVDLVGESSGGRDAETDEQYLTRLVAELELTSPIPILPVDFAQLALREPAVGRALAINLLQADPEIIEISYTGSGTATLTDRASGRSVSLASGDTAARIAAAFVALAPAAGGRYGATATGGPLNTAAVVVTLSRRAGYGPWQISSASPTVSVAVTQHGGDSPTVERAVTVAVATTAGEPLSGEDKRAVRDRLEAMRELHWITSVIDPTYTTIDVAFSATTQPGHDADVVRAAAEAAVAAYLHPGAWGSEPFGERSSWSDEPLVRYLEVAQVLNDVPGLRYVTSLGIARTRGSPGTGDITLDGPAPLPRAGTITGTVSEG